jgi:WhiB family redox-sensing transcriptional regulator
MAEWSITEARKRRLAESRRLREEAAALVQIRTEERSWQELGACVGIEVNLFFPERGGSTTEAKEVCRGCVVRETCLEYALSNGEKFGIWGGLSERERRRVRKARAQAGAA